MRSPMSQQFSFSRISAPSVERSVFNRTHGHKTTFNAGYLVPFFVDEVLPGDTFNVKATIFARLATPIYPIMDNLWLDTFYFFAPNRILWDNWKYFLGEKELMGDTASDNDYVLPTITAPAGGWVGDNNIYDYYGLPISIGGIEINALPLRMYNMVFLEWFCDQNVMTRPTFDPSSDGPDTHTNYTLLKRGKRHDYFTSCLPWPQAADPVTMPLGVSAPVYGNGKALNFAGQYGLGTEGGINGVLYADAAAYNQTSGATLGSPDLYPANKALGLAAKGSGSESSVYADLSTATAATINSIREAFQLQKFYERDARSGTRLVEIIKGHFGVDMPHALYRPEYLGGSSTRININPVQQTAPTAEGVTPMGTLAAFGLAADNTGGFTKSFCEHGYLLGLVNVRADLTYQYGLHRMWTREVREDFPWPSFMHLGEQAVLQKEIFCTGTPGVNDDDAVFGYQERYAEYRYKPSMVTGMMRSNYVGADSLHAWHLAQEFATHPHLNNNFMVDETSSILKDRVSAVPSAPDIIFDSVIEMRCARPMPMYSVPGLIDHF